MDHAGRVCAWMWPQTPAALRLTRAAPPSVVGKKAASITARQAGGNPCSKSTLCPSRRSRWKERRERGLYALDCPPCHLPRGMWPRELEAVSAAQRVRPWKGSREPRSTRHLGEEHVQKWHQKPMARHDGAGQEVQGRYLPHRAGGTAMKRGPSCGSALGAAEPGLSSQGGAGATRCPSPWAKKGKRVMANQLGASASGHAARLCARPRVPTDEASHARAAPGPAPSP